MKADYSLLFINSVVNEFQRGKEYGDESLIIPSSLFEITKHFVSIEIPYCELNEIKLKNFLNKFHRYTNNNFRILISWNDILLPRREYIFASFQVVVLSLIVLDN